ncbi:MAG: hypothetical protein PVJ55_03375 [Anaerolineae bacterium]|jgi:hypothetical protein
MRFRFSHGSLVVAWLLVLFGGCGSDRTELSQALLGRWEVVHKQGMSVPHSFFWLSMDYVEFRTDGTVWALMEWPPGGGSEIRLNGTTACSLPEERQIAFEGSCRHQGPCVGVYAATLRYDKLTLSQGDDAWILRRVGPSSEEVPPTAIGPAPSPTPVASQ